MLLKIYLYSLSYEVNNITDSYHIQLTDVIKVIEKALGQKAKTPKLYMQFSELLSTYADVGGFENYDYKPNTSIKEGINEFIDWFKKHYRNI